MGHSTTKVVKDSNSCNELWPGTDQKQLSCFCSNVYHCSFRCNDISNKL